MFPNNKIWTDHEREKNQALPTNNRIGLKYWFCFIVKDLKKKAQDRDINAGVSFKDSTYPLGRNAIAEVVGHLLKQSNTTSIEKAMVILTTFLIIIHNTNKK
jgi:hypothetical protein